MNTLEHFRRFLLVVILLGLLGMEVELLIEGHTDTILHWIPILLIALAVWLLVWLATANRSGSLRAWQVLMLAFVLSGFVGTGLHWRAQSYAHSSLVSTAQRMLRLWRICHQSRPWVTQ